ncbi:M20/M25/M40 family metallo-hydrolase [Helicobacter sp. 23-1048]
MIQKTLEYFGKIASIPHASYDTTLLFEFLLQECEKLGAQVSVDEARNIHLLKGNPKCCLQGHYDMVAVGEAREKKPLELYEEAQGERRFLRARDSSLGADNGVAIALCLALANKYDDIECLFTNDEEVGMLGAKALQLPIHATIMLNLDSENINEIVLGCAGGMDINAKKSLIPQKRKYAHFYTITAFGFQGGHSGIDINKGRDNAIIECAKLLGELPCEIMRFKGGEKRNSIPTGVEVVIASERDLLDSLALGKFCNHLESFEESTQSLCLKSVKNWGFAFRQCEWGENLSFAKEQILPILLEIKSGVYESDGAVVLNSANLSLCELELAPTPTFSLSIMARANDDEKLAHTKTHLQQSLQMQDFAVEISDFYGAWKRSIHDDDTLLQLLMKEFNVCDITPSVVQIHAGLECGILQKRISELRAKSGGKSESLKILSIGPSIDFPHSTQERLDLASLKHFVTIVENFMQSLQKDCKVG